MTSNIAQSVHRRLLNLAREQGVPKDDGLVFHGGSVQAEAIVEAAAYSGVRVRLLVTLGSARIPLYADVGFGDVIVPGPVSIQLLTLLDFPTVSPAANCP